MPAWQILLSLRGLDNAATFADRVAYGLFHVHVFARLHGPNRHQGMPVVGSCRGDDIDRFVVQRLAQILHEFWFSSLHLGDLFGPLLSDLLIGVGDIGNFGIFSPCIGLQMGFTLTINTHHGHAEFFIRTGALLFFLSKKFARGQDRHRGCGQ